MKSVHVENTAGLQYKHRQKNTFVGFPLHTAVGYSKVHDKGMFYCQKTLRRTFAYILAIRDQTSLTFNLKDFFS